jgi:hypothetical protein
MFTVKGITIDIDTVVFLVTTIIMGVKWLAERAKLPANIQKYLDAITEERIKWWVTQAATFSEYTPQERHDWVVARIEDYAEDALGINIPRSFIDIIIKYVYKKNQAKL